MLEAELSKMNSRSNLHSKRDSLKNLHGDKQSKRKESFNNKINHLINSRGNLHGDFMIDNNSSRKTSNIENQYSNLGNNLKKMTEENSNKMSDADNKKLS